MAWAFCNHTCHGNNPVALMYPTPEQILDPTQYVCPRCGTQHDPRVTRDELLLDLIKRVERLEEGGL